MPETGDKLPPETDVARLIWTPDDLQNGKIGNSAFSKSKFKEGISVDRVDTFDVAAASKTKDAQGAKGGTGSLKREHAFVAIGQCGKIEGIKQSLKSDPNTEEPVFEVVSDELEGNKAHALIKQTQFWFVRPDTERANLNKARASLVGEFSRRRVLAFDDFVRDVVGSD